MSIKDIKVWKNPTKTECRIYAHTTDDREGCYYKTGNPWHDKDSYDGNLTATEWQQVREISIWDGAWHTIYDNEMITRLAELAPVVELVTTETTAQSRSTPRPTKSQSQRKPQPQSTLDTTFNTFFNDDHLLKRKCQDCDATEQLQILYTTETGKQAWICPVCRARRNAESSARTDRARAKTRAHELFDEYEEPR